MRNFLRYKLPAVLWALLIFTVSSFPKLPSVPGGFSSIDKVAHFFEYFIFGIFLSIAFISLPVTINLKRKLLYAALVGIVYGISDEFHQSFVPGRETSLADTIADAAGAIASQFFFYSLYVRSKWLQLKIAGEKIN